MKVKIVEIDRTNFQDIPRPANRCYNCQECFYWVEKKDGRTNLVKQKKNWFVKRGRKHGGSLGKLLLLGRQETPVGFVQFGPISEFGTTRLIYKHFLSDLQKDPNSEKYQEEIPLPKGGWCISCVAIQTPHRGKGLATYLIRNVLRDVKRRGAKLVDAYPVHQARACSWNQISMGPVRLWEKCGFNQVAVIQHLKGEPLLCPEEIVLMRKQW